MHSGGGRATYPVEVSLRVVSLSSVKVIVDGRETRASATAELGFQAEDSDSVLGGLELLGDFSPDVGLLDSG